MKSILNSLIIFFVSVSMHAQVGIGTSSPDGALDIVSTDNGLIIPRVALVNTTTVTVNTPIASELVYNTTPASGFTDVSPGFYYLSSPTGPWVRLGDESSGPPPPPPPPTDAGWSLTGNAGIVEGTNFLGTTTAADVVFRRDDTESGRIGDDVTFFGVDSGLNNLAGGDNNTALGVESLRDNQTGDSNTAVGFGAFRNTTVGNNTGLGFDAGAPCTSGTGNTAIGTQALRVLSQGDNNVSIGYLSGNTATGDNNITIGYNTSVVDNTGNNQLSIGNWIYRISNGNIGINTAAPTAALSLVGNANKTGSPVWTVFSDRRSKENIETYTRGLNELMKINPVKFNYKKEFGWGTETYVGLIAQDIQKVVPSMVTEKEVNNIKDFKEVDPNELTYILVNSIKEQQVIIEKIQKDNEDLKAVNEAILKRLEALEKK